MDMRVLSSSLLHRFKLDGIEYQKNIQITDGILPFSATGLQRVKQKLLEELIPGDAELLPVHILSSLERCILHQTISNTILRYDTQSGNKSCNEATETEKLSGKFVLTDTRNCPRQQGIILTPYGTVTPGAIIGAVAATLQHQNVPVNQLIASLETPSLVDFVLPKSQMVHEPSMWYHSLMTSSVKLDNVWLATIAGDLAEMAVYQGPFVGSNMTLGATGFWNNTMRPAIYYLTSSHTNFDATRAELLGGIDGLIIASNLQTWIQDFYSLRLSQILDMYYSYDGIPFNTNIRACSRAQNFLHAVSSTILNEQTYAAAQILAYQKSVAYMSPEALQRMVDYATKKFYEYAEKHLFPELSCERVNQPQVEALIVFDGAWSTEYTRDFLAVLIQDLDVSMYGSKIGIMHGTSGEWLLNVTNSPSLAFEALNNFTNANWPTQLNYTRVLEVISDHLNKTWENNQRKCTIGHFGQVVVLLIPLGYMSNNDKQSVITMLQQIKYNHPVPRTIRPATCLDSNNLRNITPWFEDYINLAGHKDVTLFDDFKCTDNPPCPTLYFRVQNVTSSFKCAEIECRTPDQVRFIVRIKNVKNSANSNEMSSLIKLLPFIYILYVYVNFSMIQTLFNVS
ncbi:hypothetical protein WN55_06922 [Dufourea novaeangliae]|uniref:Uncharacterized protein n=1 Tax=Dufourea novaeangliae TaxID=178035 RepID=A0A154PRE0_DUFNO|nr:hypothetical protein WN55_06922 [Dufourea novaeangliae]